MAVVSALQRVMGSGAATKRVPTPIVPSARQVWRVRGLGRRFEVVRRRDLRSSERTLAFAPALLEYGLRDPISRQALVEMVRAVGGSGSCGSRAPADHDLRKLISPVLERAFRQGYFVVLAPKVAEGVSGQEEGPQTKSGAPPSAGSKAEQQVKTWVAVELLDEDGSPVSGAHYRLKTPDGSIRDGTLDENGQVRISGLEAGTCEISFPEIDGREWRPR